MTKTISQLKKSTHRACGITFLYIYELPSLTLNILYSSFIYHTFMFNLGLFTPVDRIFTGESLNLYKVIACFVSND